MTNSSTEDVLQEWGIIDSEENTKIRVNDAENGLTVEYNETSGIASIGDDSRNFPDDDPSEYGFTSYDPRKTARLVAEYFEEGSGWVHFDYGDSSNLHHVRIEEAQGSEGTFQETLRKEELRTQPNKPSSWEGEWDIQREDHGFLPWNILSGIVGFQSRYWEKEG
jgi:hypothetical protein